MTDYQADLDTYLARCRADGSVPAPGVIKTLTDAIVAAKAPAVIVPPAIDAGPERTTAQFLSDELRDEMARRNKIDADEILEQPKFDSEVHAERRQKVFGRFQIGSTRGATSVNGDTP